VPSVLSDRLSAVQAAVADAAGRAGRDASSITTVVVTKFHPASLVRELAGLGVANVGESRHQEASAKAAELADLGLTWHYVGQLQSKKAKHALDYARVIHSLDRESLVDALAATAIPVDAFVQVNLTSDPARGGVAPENLDAFVERVLASQSIRLLGLMTVAPRGEPARPAFARMRELSERLATQAPEATALSMGMSGDFADAILEGATHLRIGTAITGNRPVDG
jgi:PLP dependent protein